ncbi:MAG: SurA N-terminal domain-containing protein [Candidatus Brocadiaceae bacterium]|jgi:foldase protein PrsA
MLRRESVLITLLLAVACPAALAQVVARVNGEDITRPELGRALVQSLGKGALESLVDRRLVEQEAARRGIGVSPEELAARKELEIELRMRVVYENARMGPEQFRRTAEQYGWDMDRLREELAGSISDRRVRLKLLAQKLLEPRLEVDEAALRRHYARTRARRYSTAHIVVADRTQAEALVELLRREPDSWTAAVLRYSQDRASVPHKGRMPLVPADSELGRVLADMEPGELTIHALDDRWHVLRFVGTVPREPGSFEELKDRLRAELLALRAAERHFGLLAELHRRSHFVPNLSSRAGVRALLGEEVVAYVNGEPVAFSELSDALVEEFGPAALESYIERTLVFQEAEKRGLVAPDSAMQKRLSAVAEQLFEEQARRREMTPKKMAEFLGRAGVAVREFKDMLVREFVSREDVRATLLAERMVADDVEVTEADLKEAYSDLGGERWIVREMTVEDAAAAQRLYEELARGADFEMLLRAQSGAPGKWVTGAALLQVTSSHPYYPYVKNVDVGQVSGVFKHDGLYRIIKVVRHSVPSERPPLESVREQLEREVFLRKARERIRALLIKLKAESQIQVNLK